MDDQRGSLGALAHDLNNLLTTIVGDADMLVAALPEGPEREDAAEILDAGRRAASLIRMLPVARAGDDAADWDDDGDDDGDAPATGMNGAGPAF